MKNDLTRQKIKELLSSDSVIDKVMNDLNWIVNDDMMTGATLVAEIKYPECALNDIQLQVRLVVRKIDFYPNHNNKSPHFDVNNKLDIKQVERHTKYKNIFKLTT